MTTGSTIATGSVGSLSQQVRALIANEETRNCVRAMIRLRGVSRLGNSRHLSPFARAIIEAGARYDVPQVLFRDLLQVSETTVGRIYGEAKADQVPAVADEVLPPPA